VRGYWHIPALASVAAVCSIYFEVYWFMIGFFLWLCYLFYSERLGRIPIFVSLISFFFFLLYIPSPETAISPQSNSPEKTMPVTGKIVKPVSITSQKLEFIVEEQQTAEKILILHFPEKGKLNSDIKQLKYGANCTIYGEMELPSKSRNPGQFDYRNYLLSSGIANQVVLDSLDEINCSGESILHRIYGLRTKLLTHVNTHVSEETAAWLNALVFGDDSGIEEETIQLFQRWGLSHILAISGLHVGIVVALIYFILIKLNLLTKEKAQIFMVCFLPVFALLAGGEPSVLRASMMVVLLIILTKLKINMSITDILSVVFLLLILFDKYIVYRVGFQLSFLVTLGLILSKKIIAEEDSVLIQGLKISFISQMMIIPLQFAYFSTFQPLSILLNVIIVPYFSLFVIPFMFFLFFLSALLPPLLSILDAIFSKIHPVLLHFIEWIDQVAYYPWVIGSFSIGMAFIYYLLFFLFMVKLENRKHKTALMYGILVSLLIMAVAFRPFLSPAGTVTMLDIGQGDAFIIELPYRRGVIMIDAGANFSFDDMEASDRNYNQIIKPYLHSKGIDKIDALILSHEDTDHIGSVPYIIEELDVTKVVISNYFEVSNDLVSLLEERHVGIEYVERGDQLVVQGQTFYVMAPYKDHQSANDNSLVLYTEIGGKNWLFTGDISKDQERELIKTYPKLTVDVLKVAHHGSGTSTDETFIRHTAPQISLISVGENNAYGHPSQEVLTVLEENNVSVYRTDLYGAVEFRYQGEEGTFYRFLP